LIISLKDYKDYNKKNFLFKKKMNILDFRHSENFEAKSFSEKDLSLALNYKPIRILLDITAKLNSTFINARDQEEILQAILVGITSGEGLGFNRAFFFQMNKAGNELQGKYAIGPSSVEDAYRIWDEISSKRLTLFDVLKDVRESFSDDTLPLNNLIKGMSIPLSQIDHPYSLAFNEERTVWMRGHGENQGLSDSIKDIFGVDDFVAVPVITESEGFGVIHADNYVTNAQINREEVDALQLFASLASLAVSRNKTCRSLEEKIDIVMNLNERLEQDKEHMLQAERYSIIGRVTDQIVHEVRNPLTILGGMAKILKKRVRDKELEGFVEIIANEVGRIEEIMGGLTMISHNAEPVFEKVSLKDLIEECLAIFKTDIDRQNIVCRCHPLNKDLEPLIDHNMMKQALINILKNSLEAMPGGGLLTVCAHRERKLVKILASDTGLGIAKGHIDKVDEPFFTTKTSGIGLGLSLAKHYIKLNKGDMALARNKHGGTSATITLPLE
jgi:signal transduction histidine kinase